MCSATSSSITPASTSTAAYSTNPQIKHQNKERRILRPSLALSVYFRNEALGMKEYEILSRATAFLVAVDPPTPNENPNSGDRNNKNASNLYQHMIDNEARVKSKLHKQDYAYEPAGGPTRNAQDLNWLEFCPGHFRPLVHVMASSHVLSPWLWKKYYSQPWLEVLQQDQVQYSMDVIQTTTTQHPYSPSSSHTILASFPLQPFPIHHPSGLDIAITHLKEEEKTLPKLKELRVPIHHLMVDPTWTGGTKTNTHTDILTIFQPGQEFIFDGYHVQEEYTNTAYLGGVGIGGEEGESTTTETTHPPQDIEEEQDKRIFVPFTTRGTLIYTSSTRFLAKTQDILPEGLCGGPVFHSMSSHTDSTTSQQQQQEDEDKYVYGMIEGIVHKNHTDSRIAGAAAFIPSFTIREFINYAEQKMLQQILPKHLYDSVVDIKNGKGLTHSEQQQPLFTSSSRMQEGKEDDDDDDDTTSISSSIHTSTSKRIRSKSSSSSSSISTTLDETYNDLIQQMKQKLTPEQVEAVVATIERERQEVIDILQREGGDVDNVIEKVRRKTREQQVKILKELRTAAAGETLVDDAEYEEMDRKESPSQVLLEKERRKKK